MATIGNRLVRGTALERLGRVPASADALWALAHRVEAEGGGVLAAGILVDHLPVIYERLGLALVAAADLEREAVGSLRQRLLAVALFELVGGLLARAEALARALFGLEGRGSGDGADGAAGAAAPLTDPALLERLAARDPVLARDLAAQRARLRRAAQLCEEASDPERLRFERPAGEARDRVEPKRVELSAEGVSVEPGPRRRWLPLSELAAELSADATDAVEAVALAAARLCQRGEGPPLDRRLERR